MKQLNFLFALLFSVSLCQVFQACDCVTVDCDDGSIQVLFLSAADDSDLFGNGTYDVNNLGVFALKNNIPVAHPYRLDTIGDYTIIYMKIATDATGYIFRLNSQELDTVMLNYSIHDSKCCGKGPLANFAVYRGDTIPANGYLNLKK